MMKALIRILLLASFAAVVVLTVLEGSDILITSIFIFMLLVVGVNYKYVYSVPEQKLNEFLDKGEQIRFSAFGTRLISPADAVITRSRVPTQRGRLIATEKGLRFFAKKDVGKTYEIQETFSLPMKEIEAVGLGQVLSMSHGLIVTGKKDQEAHFAIRGMSEKLPQLKAALGLA